MKTHPTYRHYRLPLGRDSRGGKLYHPGGITVAVVKWPKEYGTGPLAGVGFAFCSPDDQFNRMTGREYAYRRAINVDAKVPQFHVRVSAPDGCPVEGLIVDAFLKLQKRGDLPTWAERQLKKFWTLMVVEGERALDRMNGGA
jgi:hypothetical protein